MAARTRAAQQTQNVVDEPMVPGGDNSLQEDAKKWRSRFWLSVSAKAPMVGEWVTFDRFYQAEQWDLRRPTWRPDPVLNMVYQVVDEHASQLAQYDPSPIILPQKPSDTDAAEMFKQLAKWWWARHRLPDILDEAIVTMLLLGTAIIKVSWDPSLTGGTQTPEMIPQADPNVPPEEIPGTLWKGDVTAQHVDPANFYVDPGAYDVQSAAWCGTMVPKPVDYVRQKYPKWADRIQPEYSFNLSEIYYRPSTFQAFQASMGPYGSGYVNVFEGWEKTGGKDGLVRVVMVNNIIVERNPNFYEHGLYPFVRITDIDIRKSFWGCGETKQIFQNQKLINKLTELIGMSALLTGSPQREILRASGLDPKTITNEPGKNYVVNTIGSVAPIPAQVVPPYVFEMRQMSVQDISQVAGLFIAPPPGVRAAAAIIALLEKAAARMKRKANRVEHGIEEIVRLLIAHYQEFGNEVRLMRVTDDAGAVSFLPFQADQYATAEFDVDIEAGIGQPLSKAIMAEMAQQAMSLRMPDGSPALMPSEYLEAIDFPLPGVIQRLKKQEAAWRQQQQAQAGGQGAGQQAGAQPVGDAMARAALPPFAQSSDVNNRMLNEIQQAMSS